MPPPSPSFNSRRWSREAEWAAIAGFWVLLAALTLLRHALDPRGWTGITRPDTLASIAEYLLWALLTPVVFWLVRRYPLERDTWARRLALHLALAFAVAAAAEVFRLLVFQALLPHFTDEIPRRLRRRLQPGAAIAHLQFLDELVIYLAVLAAGFARDYFLRYRERQAEAARLLAETARLSGQLADARLSALRMQLNPHFLFNTLHAVSALVERDPAGVRRIIARLSTLLRRTLDESTPAEVPLRDELDFLRDYLDIQRVRFQGSLDVAEEIEAGALDALVPNLILQPLVENAVEHGVSRVEHGAGRLTVRARRAGDRLVLDVEDNGPGLSDEAAERSAQGVGLRNTRARLDALYGPAAALALGPAPGGGTRATITLPFHTADDLRASADA